jgi:GPH family glycoside/pentoside/hexuronide:cation symporter
VGAGLSILGLAGYTPNVEQTAQVQLTLRILYALVPSVCNILAFIIVLAYPISSRVHTQIRAAVAERKAGQAVADPLKSDRMIA